MLNEFAPLGKNMTRIENREIDTSYKVYLSLYHQLKNGEEDYYKVLEEDFFDLIIVDECHRGSANEDSSWRNVLEYFSSAVQIGMTATPKETEETSNIEYFGDPLYSYSLKQGISDGFLAPYKVIKVNIDIDVNGYRPYPGMLDDNGLIVEDKMYFQKDFDRKIIIPERNEVVAKRITQYMKENDRYGKVIVFL